MCEGFKHAYADFLLGCDLLGVRAALLQFTFVDDASIGKGAKGDLPLPMTKRRYSESTTGKICVACAAGAEACVACSQTPVKPSCAYCRLPIKGKSRCARDRVVTDCQGWLRHAPIALIGRMPSASERIFQLPRWSAVHHVYVNVL